MRALFPSASHFYGRICPGRAIDKSKFRLFKPLLLDVIFHDCNNTGKFSGNPMLLRDNVYENLRSDILTCRLAPGDDMREQDLAERYAVSRQPVREALLRLEREHLVTVQPRQGYRVNPISLSDARDLLRFRLALEPACVAEAIENAGDAALKALDKFRRFSGNHEDFIAYNRGFHTALAQASGNRRMAASLCDLIGQADRLVRVSVANLRGHDPKKLVAEHVALIEAMQKRDRRAAARIIKAHIGATEKRVLPALKRNAIIVVEHDPEKRKPVFRKDHAQTKSRDA
jgi:GntR family transcriptional regulator, rspAB operon transcriptional repressor